MRNAIAGLALALITGTALAQVPPGTPGVEEQAKRDAASRAAFAKMPDTPGTGPYPAVKEIDPSLPDHVVYRPRDLSALNGKKLAVLAWGNGGCRADGASARHHLAQIASHGYLAIAPGKIMSGPGAPPAPPRSDDAGQPASTDAHQNVATRAGVGTTAEDVLKGVDWAIAENGRAGSPYYGKIDTQQIAVAGHSCGGLQAIQSGADPRIKTVIVHNSGVFTDGTNPIKGMTVDKTLLNKLHTPVLYVLGGKLDVAWVNGSDDFKRITHVPVAMLDAPVGHGGTFRELNGGAVAGFTIDWLEWQLRGDKEAAKTFTGPDCRLCTDPVWTIERKGI